MKTLTVSLKGTQDHSVINITEHSLLHTNLSSAYAPFLSSLSKMTYGVEEYPTFPILHTVPRKCLAFTKRIVHLIIGQ